MCSRPRSSKIESLNFRVTNASARIASLRSRAIFSIRRQPEFGRPSEMEPRTSSKRDVASTYRSRARPNLPSRLLCKVMFHPKLGRIITLFRCWKLKPCVKKTSKFHCCLTPPSALDPFKVGRLNDFAGRPRVQKAGRVRTSSGRSASPCA